MTNNKHNGMHIENPFDELGELLYIPEAAKHAKVPITTIRYWVLKREVRTVRVGRRVRITVKSLNERIRQGFREPESVAV